MEEFSNFSKKLINPKNNAQIAVTKQLDKLLIKYISIRLAEEYPQVIDKVNNNLMFDVRGIISFLKSEIPEFQPLIDRYSVEFVDEYWKK